MKLPRVPKPVLWIFGVLALTGIGAAIAAREPDRDLVFTREMPSALPVETLATSLDSVLSWPQWHHMTVEARRVDLEGKPVPMALQRASAGARVVFTIEPRRDATRRFTLSAEVVEFVPGKKLRLRLIDDSKNRILKIFSHLDWTIEIEKGLPHGAPGLGHQAKESEGTTVRGTLNARTSHWRSRMFSRIAERILLNQVFYPDLRALAELKRPLTLDRVAPQATQ